MIMDRHIIRTSETDSVKGIASKQKIDINLSQSAKALPFPNVSSTLSQRSVYEEERQAGNKFRLILTIVPYCTNVLFNALTEIVKNEGSGNNVQVITDTTNIVVGDNVKIEGCYGINTPTRTQMISNTEYSSDKHGGFEYHPGYDFFDNHILRNSSFKVVNPINAKQTPDQSVFNTLSDFVRDRNGNVQKYVERKSIQSLANQSFNKPKHLYLVDDVLKIEDSINENLYEDNGWWGFNNNTSIESKIFNTKTKQWDDMDIGKALNNRKACEFIDMYPDRTLFSFTPKYNKFRHRTENNWNVVITYPYKNDYSHPICYGGRSYIKRSLDSNGKYVEETVSEGNGWTALKVMSVSLGSGKIGSNTLSFRTYTRHGLKQQDMFYVYYTNPYKNVEDKYKDNTLVGGEIYYESETYYKVTNVGDLNRNNNEYYFYTSNLSLLKELYTSYINYITNLINIAGDNVQNEYKVDYENDDKKGIYDENGNLKTELLSRILSKTNFRIKRSVKGVKSSYYLRVFRKVPNLRGAKRKMTDEEKLHTSKFNGVFDNFIRENALDPRDNGHQRLINNEQYQLAFSASVFNDNVAQITFTDGVDTDGLTDNLGRPLSELFYTVVKNNAGYKLWYGIDDTAINYQHKNVEFSHCFGRITSGLEMLFSKEDTESSTVPIDYLKKLSSARHIANIVHTDNGIIVKDEVTKCLEDDLSYTDTFFYGDLVEYNPIDFKETVLSNVMHRFNTAQRELYPNEKYSQYQYHEVTSDDYDQAGFKVTEFSAVTGSADEDRDTTDYQTIARPEGYIYKAHYSIPIREYTRIQQGNHFTMRVRNARPVQREGILIEVTTLVAHGLNPNDVVFICDEENDVRYVTHCVGVISRTKFLMSKDYMEIINNASNIDGIEYESNININGAQRYKKRFNYIELCDILNGKYRDDVSYPYLILRRKNDKIPDYATYIGGNQYMWRDIVNIGDSRAQTLDDYIFANGYFYVTSRINFYLKRQDPYGNNGLYFDGDKRYPYFPNDPSGIVQSENNYVEKDTTVVC